MTKQDPPKPLTVLVGGDLKEILRNRAVTNHRSVSKEIIFLVETALGCTSESVRETMHLLYKINAETETDATA